MSNSMTGGLVPGSGGHRQRVRYERSEDERPSIAVATALATYLGEDVTESTTRLYEYVDPEALDALFADTYDGRSRTDGRVIFDVGEVTVVVRRETILLYRTR